MLLFSPAELVGPGRLELPTSRLSGVRSNQAELRAYGRTTACYQARDRTLLCTGPNAQHLEVRNRKEKRRRRRPA